MTKVTSVILLCAAMASLVSCAPYYGPPRNKTVGIDLGPIFRMGLINDGVGTKLDIEVLSGLVNVGVDHRRNGFQSPEDSDYNDKPNKFRVGNTDVYVGVGRK